MTGIRRTTTRTTTARLRKALCPAPLALAVALSFNAHAATIVVDSTGTDSEMGKCTIVDAVAAVNSALAVNGCAAGDGDNDTIDLNSFTSPTTIEFTSVGLTMQSHALLVSNPVTISAPLDATGTPLVTLTRSTVSGTPAFGIIHFSSPATITGLAITNGNSGLYLGGGILAGAALTIQQSVISGNSSDSSGGGIAGTAKITLQHSILSGNTAGNAGGGIYGSSAVEIDYSTVKNNSTTGATGSLNGGGGVFSRGSVRLLQADILDNTSASAAGGVYSSNGMSVAQSTITGNIATAGSGGGLYGNPATNGVTLEVSSSTLTGNTAQGNGGAVFGGAVGLENSTLTDNVASGTGGGVQAVMLMTNYATIAQNQSTGAGGGASFSSSAQVDATILFGNTTGSAVADDIEGATAMTGGHDIIGATNAGVPEGTLNCDPHLSALADNGGPTQTMALTSGSCAIDAADTTLTVAVDQRGYPRPVGSGSPAAADIGAFEYGSSDPDVIFKDGFGG
jgi:predicted outer membrane repeat protein